MTEEKKVTANRNSRESEAHDKESRRKPWRPVRRLETPPAPPGYTYRWIRESMLGQEDRANVSRRLREGWELVRGTDLPSDWELPTADDQSRHAGIVYNEGLLLAKIPNETVEERRDYYQGKSKDAVDALDNSMFSESRRDGKYVKYDPQRDSRVSFGKK
jgi:hypothetical protein|tara:strand:- start:1693 stop:2172 length:480 start_codon:yes stop_codon:yes gene_type:complete